MEVIANLYNPALNMAVVSWREVYLLPDTRLLVEYHAGALHYRQPGTNTRTSYRKLKRGLRRKRIVILEELPF